MCQTLAYCSHVLPCSDFYTVEEATEADVEDGELEENVRADGSRTLVSSRVSPAHIESTDHENSTDGKPHPFLSFTSVSYMYGH